MFSGVLTDWNALSRAARGTPRRRSTFCSTPSRTSSSTGGSAPGDPLELAEITWAMSPRRRHARHGTTSYRAPPRSSRIWRCSACTILQRGLRPKVGHATLRVDDTRRPSLVARRRRAPRCLARRVTTAPSDAALKALAALPGEPQIVSAAGITRSETPLLDDRESVRRSIRRRPSCGSCIVGGLDGDPRGAQAAIDAVRWLKTRRASNDSRSLDRLGVADGRPRRPRALAAVPLPAGEGLLRRPRAAREPLCLAVGRLSGARSRHRSSAATAGQRSPDSLTAAPALRRRRRSRPHRHRGAAGVRVSSTTVAGRLPRHAERSPLRSGDRQACRARAARYRPDARRCATLPRRRSATSRRWPGSTRWRCRRARSDETLRDEGADAGPAVAVRRASRCSAIAFS